MRSFSGALGQFGSPYFVLARRQPSTYTHVRLGLPTRSGLVWLATCPRAGAIWPPAVLGGWRERQADRETAAGPWGAVHGDGATVGVHDGPHQGEPQPRAARVAAGFLQ